jgi:hypothetical protein
MDFSIEEYYESIQQNIGNLYAFKQLESGYIQVRTPYHYPDGSVIDVYIKGTTITDLGETARVLDNFCYAGKDLTQYVTLEGFVEDKTVHINNREVFITDCDFIHKGIVRVTEALIKLSNSIYTYKYS